MTTPTATARSPSSAGRQGRVRRSASGDPMPPAWGGGVTTGAGGGALLHQQGERIDDESGEAPDQGAVEPDELQVPPHRQLQPVGGNLRIPAPDGILDERPHFVPVPLQ